MRIDVDDVRFTGDHRLFITYSDAHGSRQVEIDVPPAEIITVNNERYPSLPEYKAQTWAGYAKGERLNGVRAQECTAKYALDPESVSVSLAGGGQSVLMERGRDYDLDADWGSIWRLPDGRINADTPVLISYCYCTARIDGVVVDSSGRCVLRKGESHIAVPHPPALAEGQMHLANVLISGAQLLAGDVFPVSERSYPETPADRSYLAERIPRSLAKLAKGETIRIMAWGDSVTHGGYLPDADDRWQVQFTERLHRQFPNAVIELVTEAWPGRNTNSYFGEPPGAEHNYEDKVLALKPDLIISEFVNDAPISNENLTANYSRIAEDLKMRNIEWIILAPHYIRGDMMGLSSQAGIDDDPRPYVHFLRRFSAEKNIALADASLRWGRLWRQGIPYLTLLHNNINHPDVRGMKIFADSLMGLFKAVK